MRRFLTRILFGLGLSAVATGATAQSCKGWEVNLSKQSMANPVRTVTVNTRDPRIFCSKEAEQKGDCSIAPMGIFHVLALVQCPPRGDAAEFDQAVLNPNGQYDLKLLNVCTAVRISRNWALTAAHCVAEKDGSLNIAEELALAIDFEASGVRHLAVLPIKSIHRSDDDFALLQFDPSVAPAYRSVRSEDVMTTEIYDSEALREEEFSHPKKATIWGYGETNDGIGATGGLVGRLVSAKVPLDHSTLTESERTRLLRANSADPNAPKLCSGDSGGPLYLQDSMLLGLSIKSSATCEANSSNIADAIRVAPFCDWIESTTCAANGNAVCCVRGGNYGQRSSSRTTANGCICGN